MKATDQLQRFYRKANQDNRLLPSHISLYFGLIWVWSLNNFAAKFKIYRKDLMRFSHINSIVTYHKCIRELTDYGYIVYKSSYNYHEGCEIYLPV